MRKSKTLATWIALAFGCVGLHRFYLHGFRDVWGWLYPLPTFIGLYGLERVQQFGQDDQLSWALIPLVGCSVAVAMLTAIVYGLTTDEKWDARFNPLGPASKSGWAVIIGVIIALMIGAGVLMATIAFSGQRFFEHQIEGNRLDPGRHHTATTSAFAFAKWAGIGGRSGACWPIRAA